MPFELINQISALSAFSYYLEFVLFQNLMNIYFLLLGKVIPETFHLNC